MILEKRNKGENLPVELTFLVEEGKKEGGGDGGRQERDVEEKGEDSDCGKNQNVTLIYFLIAFLST